MAKPLLQTISESFGWITTSFAGIAAIFAVLRSLYKVFSAKKQKLEQLFVLLDENKALKKEVAKTRTIINATHLYLNVAIWECDAEGYCTDASPALCELFGRTQEEMFGQGWTEAIVGDKQREEAWGTWARSVKNGYPYHDSYVVLNRKTKVRYKCLAVSYTVKDDQGNIIGFVGTVTKEPEDDA